MSVAKVFFDTNILLYLLSEDDLKADKTEQLVAGGGIISVQVMNEFASVAKRKLQMNWPEISDVLTSLRSICDFVPLTEKLHRDAITIAERYGFTFYDSLIVAAAINVECDMLYAEDLQSGQQIEKLLIKNPYDS